MYYAELPVKQHHVIYTYYNNIRVLYPRLVIKAHSNKIKSKARAFKAINKNKTLQQRLACKLKEYTTWVQRLKDV